MSPLLLESDDADGEILGVNTIDINPAHQLIALGVDGNGTVQFWDPRSRAKVGTLRLPRSRLLSTGGFNGNGEDVDLSVTAIASRADGLSYAVGTSTGHTLLYDIRAAQPFGLKDQGYGLPVKNVAWIEGGSRMAGDGMILSADKKVMKIWDRSSVSLFHQACITCNQVLTFAWIAIDKFRIYHTSSRFKSCTPYTRQWSATGRKRSYLHGHVLHSSTWSCTSLGKFP